MVVNVYGCGFAGITSALGLCERGHRVFGVDTDLDKIQLLRKGQSLEANCVVDGLIRKYLGTNLSFHNYGSESVDIDAAFVVLPTPFDGQSLAIDGIKLCCNHILQNWSTKKTKVIFIRSTLPIGGLIQIESFLEKENQFVSGEDFQIFYFPEFMREGTGLEDVEDPPLAVLGIGKSKPQGLYLDLISKVKLKHLPSKEAEALKLFSNAFHAAKVTFANEAMRICEANDLSANNVMDIFCQDTKLNISPKYLRPGFSWGGGCLGKDTKALTSMTPHTPLLESLFESNDEHIHFFARQVLAESPSSVGFLGASFKENVSDIRDSAVTKLIRLCNGAQSVSRVVVIESSNDLIGQLKLCEKVKLSSDLTELSHVDVVVCWAQRFEEISSLLSENQTCIQL